MDRFQPGEEAYIRLVFGHAVPIKNAYIVFVHEGDENEHIVFGFKTEDDHPLAPNRERLIDFAVTIERDQKPGVYALDKIYFETFGGSTVDHQGDFVKPRFEVIPERRDATPLVEGVTVFTRAHWELMRRREG